MPEVSKDFKKKLMKLIKENPISISELSRKLKVRREFVSGYLEALKNAGEVKVIKVGRSKVYKPK